MCDSFAPSISGLDLLRRAVPLGTIPYFSLNLSIPVYNGGESGFTPLDQPRRLLACVWNLRSSGQDYINHDAIAGFQIGGAAGQRRQRLGTASTAIYILSELFGGCESGAEQIARS